MGRGSKSGGKWHGVLVPPMAVGAKVTEEQWNAALPLGPSWRRPTETVEEYEARLERRRQACQQEK